MHVEHIRTDINTLSPRMDAGCGMPGAVITTGTTGDVSMLTSPQGDHNGSLMDRFLGSPSDASPAGKKRGSTMQRKLADMLGPLLVGGRSKASPRDSAPTTPRQGQASPRPAAAAAPNSNAMMVSPRPAPAANQAMAEQPAEELANMEVSDGARSKKSSADSNMSTASVAANTMVPSPMVAQAPAPAPDSTPTGPSTANSSGPALLTPQLDRLLRAARYCALPPSPRAEPPAGSPAGTPNQTTLLALSHTLPPRMVRPSWCVDDYVIGEKLYTGYASTVYKAQCKRSGETVVLKIYTLAAVCDLYKYQIYREVRVHASLQHENIVTLYAAFQEGDRIIMVQEYADGSDLFTLLHKYGGRLSERLAVQMVLDPFLRVLHYLHTRGIIHRDIKPENILFTKNMVLKLGDFGLAIDLREERAVTRAGTLDYMAPEVLRCPFKSRPEENKENIGLHYGARVDAWAVGVLTFELLAGYPPFFDQSRTNTEQHIVTKVPEFPAAMSEEAKSFISRALLKSAADRPTIHEMLMHTWVDQYRARRSMRAMQSGSTSSGSETAQAVRTAVSAMQAASSKARMVTPQPGVVHHHPQMMHYMPVQMPMGSMQMPSTKAPHAIPLTHMMSPMNEESASAPTTPITIIPPQFNAHPYNASYKPIVTPQTRLAPGMMPVPAGSFPVAMTGQPMQHPSGDAAVYMNVNQWQVMKTAPPPAQVMARVGMPSDKTTYHMHQASPSNQLPM